MGMRSEPETRIEEKNKSAADYWSLVNKKITEHSWENTAKRVMGSPIVLTVPVLHYQVRYSAWETNHPSWIVPHTRNVCRYWCFPSMGNVGLSSFGRWLAWLSQSSRITELLDVDTMHFLPFWCRMKDGEYHAPSTMQVRSELDSLQTWSNQRKKPWPEFSTLHWEVARMCVHAL